MSYNRHFGYKYSHFGEDTFGHDVKAFGDTTGKYVMWDASADTFFVVGTLDIDGAILVGVNDTGYDVTFFGATSGKKFFWDESADTAFLTCTVDIDGTVTVGVNDTGYDVKFFGATAGKYWLWDESEDEMVIVGTLDITGASQFTGAVTVGVNDTGHDVEFFGATSGKYLLWDESADALIVNGIIQSGTVTTAALAIGGGTSATKLTTATADKNFIGFWTETTATTGDSRAMYIRHYLGGTITSAGYGDAIRAFCTVAGTNYDYASGIHATMQINAGASVTGSGAAGRFTLAAAAESRTLDGALAALQLDSDIGAGNTLPSRAALIRLAKSGSVDVTNFLDISDDQCLKGSSATGAATNALPVIMPDGSTLYISLIAAS